MKNYTGLQKIKASEVIDTFKEEVVTEETFAEKVAKGYLYKGFEPPENATMLKFRYYSPEKVLIEQNNVPVVYDGTSITDVINYYYLTDKSSGVTFDYATKDSYGWTTGIQTVTKDKRFLWSVTETRYSNTIDGQAGTLTEPCIISIYGEKGERGAIYLGHYTDNQACYEANKPAVFSGDYYLNTTDGYIYTYDDESNKWAKISDYADYRYSIAMNDIIGALQDTKLTNFITAKTGWFENLAVGILRSQKLFSKEITLTDGGLIQSDGFQSGKSGWQIDYNGKAEFNDTTVRGKIYASDGEFKGKINAATISGSTISGGSITIGDNFKVTNKGDLTAKKCFLQNIEVDDNLIINGDYLCTPTVNPYVTAQPLCGGIRAMMILRAGEIVFKTNNIDSITNLDTGIYLVKFNTFACVSIAFGYFSYGATVKLSDITVDKSVNFKGYITRISRNIGIITDYDYAGPSGEVSTPYKVIECRDLGNSLKNFTNNVNDFAMIWFQY